MTLREGYEIYKQAFYDKLEYKAENNRISEPDYYKQLNAMLTYDEYIGGNIHGFKG